MNENPLVANLVANLQPSDIVLIASQVASMLKPSMKRRKKHPSVKGLFKHSRSGFWYWRFTCQGKRYVIPLRTTDDQKAQVAALREMTALYGTSERKTTQEEKNAYIANLEAQQASKKAEQHADGKSTFTPDGFIEWYGMFNKAPGRHRPTTVLYASNHIRLLTRETGVSDIRRITPLLLNQWRDKRLRDAAEKGKAHALRAATSVATICRNVRMAFAQAAKSPNEGGAGILLSNPLETWKPFTKAERQRLVSQRERFLPTPKLSIEDVKRLLETADAYSQKPHDQDPLHISATCASKSVKAKVFKKMG